MKALTLVSIFSNLPSSLCWLPSWYQNGCSNSGFTKAHLTMRRGELFFPESLNEALPFTLIGVIQNKLCDKKMPCVLIGLGL